MTTKEPVRASEQELNATNAAKLRVPREIENDQDLYQNLTKIHRIEFLTRLRCYF